MRKIKADPENCVWFYSSGWRYGKIIKVYSDTKMTAEICTGGKYKILKKENGKWAAVTNKEFKGQKHLDKRKKKKAKKKTKVKIKIKKRKVRRK